jgi:hypothetical protein
MLTLAAGLTFAAMEEPALDAGERVLRVVVQQLLATPPTAFAIAGAALVPAELAARLPAGVLGALYNVASRAAHAAAVARLARVWRTGCALAAASLPAPARAARRNKLATLRDVAATTLDVEILADGGVQATLVALCAPDAPAVPPLLHEHVPEDLDEAAEWGALGRHVCDALRAPPDQAQVLLIGMLMQASSAPPDEDGLITIDHRRLMSDEGLTTPCVALRKSGAAAGPSANAVFARPRRCVVVCNACGTALPQGVIS